MSLQSKIANSLFSSMQLQPQLLNVGNNGNGSNSKRIISNSQQRKIDTKTVTNFIQTISNNKEAFDLFKEEAIKKGIFKDDPLPLVHHRYYQKYIKPGGETPKLNRSLMENSHRSHNPHNLSTMTKDTSKYIPLRDLLRQNHDEKVQGYLDKLKQDGEEDKQNKSRFKYQTVDNRNNSLNNSLIIGGGNQRQDQHHVNVNLKIESFRNKAKNDFLFNTEQQMQQTQGKFKVELFTPFHVKKEESLQIPKLNTQQPSLDVTTIHYQNLLLPHALPEIQPLKKSNLTSYSPIIKKQKQKQLLQNNNTQSQQSVNINDNSGKKKQKQSNIGGLGAISNLLNNSNSEDTSGDEEQSIMSKNKNKPTKFTNQSTKAAKFHLDRKDQNLMNHFYSIGIDKRLNKTKMREFLCKRYPEHLTERIMKGLMPHFNNFSFNLDFNFFCDSMENFVNQSEQALKMFIFKILDVNHDKKLSESDLFQIMMWSSQSTNTSSQNKLQQSNLDYGKDDECLPQINQDADLFLEVFSNDFVKITKNINLKRRVRGRDDQDRNRLKAIEQKLMHMEQTMIPNTMDGGFSTNPREGKKKNFNKKSKNMMQNKKKNMSNLNLKYTESAESSSVFEEGDNQKSLDLNNETYQKKKQDHSSNRSSNQTDNGGNPQIMIQTQGGADDQQESLNFNEFSNISFKNGFPQLIFDIVFYLTRKNLAKGNQIWEEDEEYSPTVRDYSKYTKDPVTHDFQDNDLLAFKESMPLEEYNVFLTLFKRLLGLELTDKKVQFQFKDANTFLTEKMIVDNFKPIFGYDSPYFAKLIYLLLAKGYDKCKIGLSRLIQEFYPLIKEEMNGSHNKIAFKIYDMDRDGQLNILNLLHLQQNIIPQSIVGQEIFKQVSFFDQLYRIMEFYFKTNIKNKNVIRKIEIDYELFPKIVQKSVLVEVFFILHYLLQELKTKLFKLPTQSMSIGNFKNIFAEDQSLTFTQEYLFKDIDVDEEQTYGQRGFQKNMDKMLQKLIKFYNKYQKIFFIM